MGEAIYNFRPDDLGKIFGQDHLIELLVSWMEDVSKIPQSILFAGPYGVGKTSVARIFASKLASSKVDIKEINAADARGIDDARGWADSAKFSPMGGKGKVYIIDELHQMTSAAQSALLKVIEEPPACVYFFLCTTEPFKLLPAIRSRCTAIELKLLELSDTRRMLSFVFGKRLSKEIMDAIHVKSGGHARDAVKMGEIALMTNVVNPRDLDGKVGFGRNEIERVFLEVFSKKVWIDRLSVLTRMDHDLTAQVLDYMADNALMENNAFIVKTYSKLLEKRVARRENKVSSAEQIMHFISEYLNHFWYGETQSACK